MNYIHPRHHNVQNPELGIHNAGPPGVSKITEL